MPGIPYYFIYYGDEIGMKYLYDLPNKEGATDRAGTHTPMQWIGDETAGFSTCSPNNLYLPVDTEKRKISVGTEESDKNSMLNFVRRLIKLQHSYKALNNEGEWELVSDIDQPYPIVLQAQLWPGVLHRGTQPVGQEGEDQHKTTACGQTATSIHKRKSQI